MEARDPLLVRQLPPCSGAEAVPARSPALDQVAAAAAAAVDLHG